MYLIYCHSWRRSHSSVPEKGSDEVGNFKTHWCVSECIGPGNTSESKNLWGDLGQVSFASCDFLASLETSCQSFHSLIEAAILGGTRPPCSIPGLKEKIFLHVLPTPCTRLVGPPGLLLCLDLSLGYGEEGALPCALCAPAGILYVAGAARCALPACLKVDVGQLKSLLSS